MEVDSGMCTHAIVPSRHYYSFGRAQRQCVMSIGWRTALQSRCFVSMAKDVIWCVCWPSTLIVLLVLCHVTTSSATCGTSLSCDDLETRGVDVWACSLLFQEEKERKRKERTKPLWAAWVQVARQVVELNKRKSEIGSSAPFSLTWLFFRGVWGLCLRRKKKCSILLRGWDFFFGSYLRSAVKDRSQEECLSLPSKSFLSYGKTLELVDEYQILAWSAGLRFVGFAARAAGVQARDVVMRMWRVVTSIPSKMIGRWAEVWKT